MNPKLSFDISNGSSSKHCNNGLDDSEEGEEEGLELVQDEKDVLQEVVDEEVSESLVSTKGSSMIGCRKCRFIITLYNNYSYIVYMIALHD